MFNISLASHSQFIARQPEYHVVIFENVSMAAAAVNSTRNCSAGSASHTTAHVEHPAHCVVFDFVMEAVVMGLLAVFGCIGNSLSLLVLFKEKSKSVTPFLLMALVVTETVFLVTVLIVRVLTSVQSVNTSEPNPVSPLLPYFGSYVYPIAMIAETGTIWLTILVTVNRYVAVCRPYDVSHLASKYTARKHVILVVVFAVLYNVPRFFDYRVITKTVVGPNCTATSDIYVNKTNFASNTIYNLVYHNIMYFLVMYIIPLVTLVVLNLKLTKALKKTRERRRTLVSVTESQHNAEDDITTILIVVVIVFIVCQTPALITQSLLSVLSEESTFCPNFYFYYARCSDTLVVLNSSMNFIIYIFCSRRFRQIFTHIICSNLLRGGLVLTDSTRHTTIQHSTL